MGRSRMARVVALLVLIGAIALGSTDGVSDLDGRVVPLNEEQQALRLMEAGPGADLQALRQKALKKAEEVRELEQEKAKLEAQDSPRHVHDTDQTGRDGRKADVEARGRQSPGGGGRGEEANYQQEKE